MNRQETHFSFDGLRWQAYSERASHIRRLTTLFGPPTRRGRGLAVAFWDSIPPKALRWGKRRAPNNSTPPTPHHLNKKPANHA